MEFVELLTTVFQLKSDSIRESFLKFLEMRLFPQKKSVMYSYPGNNLQYF